MGYLIGQEGMLQSLFHQVEVLLATESLEPPADAPFLNDGDYLNIREITSRLYRLLHDMKSCVFAECPVAYLQDLHDSIYRIDQPLKTLQIFYANKSADFRQELPELNSIFKKWYYENYSIIVDAIIRDTRPELAIIRAAQVTDMLNSVNARAALVEKRDKDISDWYLNEKTRAESWSDERGRIIQSHENAYRELIDRIRKTLGEIGSQHHAHKFKLEARNQTIGAYVWLAITLLLSWKIVEYALSIEPKILEVLKDGVEKVWPLFAVRGVVISIGSILLFVCVRSYSACRHNATVNRHRENALSTFTVFANGAHDNDTKNAILMEASRAVFAAAPSGYLKAANESNPSTHLVEMVRTHSGGKSHEE